jgi:hypothetical protein
MVPPGGQAKYLKTTEKAKPFWTLKKQIVKYDLLYCIITMGRDYVCGNATANGPIVHPPDDTWMDMELRWNDIETVKPKDSEKNLSQCYTVHHKPQLDCPGRETGPPL